MQKVIKVWFRKQYKNSLYRSRRLESSFDGRTELIQRLNPSWCTCRTSACGLHIPCYGIHWKRPGHLALLGMILLSADRERRARGTRLGIELRRLMLQSGQLRNSRERPIRQAGGRIQRSKQKIMRNFRRASNNRWCRVILLGNETVCCGSDSWAAACLFYRVQTLCGGSYQLYFSIWLSFITTTAATNK